MLVVDLLNVEIGRETAETLKTSYQPAVFIQRETGSFPTNPQDPMSLGLELCSVVSGLKLGVDTREAT